MSIWDDLKNAYNSADDWYKRETRGAGKARNQAIHKFASTPLLPGPESDKERQQDPFLGAGAKSSGKTGAGKSYDPDNMIRTYLPGIANDPQKFAAVKEALQGEEKGSGVAYHQALDKLVGLHPELSQYSKWGQAFPAQTPGALSPEQSQQLWAAADKYEQPYIDAMKSDSAMLGASLKDLMPRLPKGYQSLLQAEMPSLVNLPNQIANLIHESNPAAIANAWQQYYGSGSGATASSGANPITSLLNAGKNNPQALTGGK